MSTRVENFFVVLFIYVIVGCLVGVSYQTLFDVPNTGGNALTLLVFWPLFLIKMVGLGLWFLLTNLVTLLS